MNKRHVPHLTLVSALAAAALLLGFAEGAWAATMMWDGGGADSNASTAANWCVVGTGANTVPGASDTAQFGGTGASCTADTAKSPSWNSTAPSAITNLTLSTGYTPTVTLAINVTISGTLTLNGGTLNAGATTLTLSGSGTPLTKGSGTFTPGTSTVVYACSSACNMPTLTYNNVTVNAPGVTVTLTGTWGQTIINGNLYVQAGTFSRAGACGPFGCDATIQGNITADAGTTLTDVIAGYVFSGTTQSISLGTPAQQSLGQMAVGTASTNPTVTLLTDVYANWGVTVGTATASTGTLNLNGKTLTVGGGNVRIYGGGTFLNASGSFVVGGAFGPRTITDDTGTQNFGALTVASSGQTVILNSNITANTVTVSGGTLSLNGKDLTIGTTGVGGVGSIAGSGTVYCGNGDNTCSAGTVTLRGTGNLGPTSGAWTFYNLTLGDNSATELTTLAGNFTVANSLTIQSNHVLYGADKTVTLSGGGTPFAFGGSERFNPGTSTIVYTGASPTIAPASYHHLTLNGSGTYTLGSAASQTITVNGTLRLQAGTANASTNNPNIAIGGTLQLDLGTVWTSGSGTITFAGGATSITDSTNPLQTLGAVVAGQAALTGANTWWAGGGSGTYAYRRRVTSVDTVHDAVSTSDYYAAALDTSDAARFQANCNDLRVVHQQADGTMTELGRSVTGCRTVATRVYFKAQDALAANASLDAQANNYFIYYGNASAGASSATYNNATSIDAPYAKDSNTMLLVHYDETSGTTASDSSDTARNGTLENGLAFSNGTVGRFGNGLSYDSTDDDVNFGDHANFHLTTAMTIEAWVKPESVREVFLGGSYVMTKGTVWWLSADYALVLVNGGVECFLNNGGAQTLGAAYTLNKWQHVACTYNQVTLKPVMNGVPATGLSYSTAITVDANKPLQNSANGGRFDGLIDEVRVSNIVRAFNHVVIPPQMTTAMEQRQSPTLTLGTSATVASMVVNSGNTLDLGSSHTLTLVGTTGYPLQINGTFTPSSSTVSYTGAAVGGNLDWSQTVDPHATKLDQVKAVAVDSTGVYLAGFDANGASSTNEWRIEKRRLLDGALCTAANAADCGGSAFNTTGVITEDVASSSNEQAFGIAIDGTYLYVVGFDTVGGDSRWRMEKRLLSTGDLCDTAHAASCGGVVFGTEGVQSLDVTANNDIAYAAAVDSTGLYVVGARQTSSPGNDDWEIRKVHLDTGAHCTDADPCGGSGFSSDGAITWAPSTWDDRTYAVAVDATDVYVVGFRQSSGVSGSGQWAMMKRNKLTGAVVSGFGDASGIVLSNPTGTHDSAQAVAVDSSGLYVAGYQNGTSGVWRIEKHSLSDGQYVPAFGASYGTNGWVVHALPTADEQIKGLAIDGSYLYAVGYDSGESGSQIQWRIEKRGLTDGALAADFKAGAAVTSDPTSAADKALAVAIGPSMLYVVGDENTTTSTKWRLEAYKPTGGATIASATYNHLNLGDATAAQSATYAAGGNLTVNGALTIVNNPNGTTTFNPGVYTVTLANAAGAVAAPFVIGAGEVFAPASSTIAYTGDYTGGNTTVAAATYKHLQINKAGEIFAAGGAIIANGDVTVSAGTLAMGANDLTVNGGDISVSGALSQSAANKTTVVTSGSIGGAGATTFGSLDIGSASSTQTTTAGGNFTVGGVLTIVSSSGTNTFDASSKMITLSGTSGTPFVINATEVFTPSTSTVKYTGNNTGGNTTVTATTYNNLTFDAAETFVAGALVATGDVNVTAGALSLGGASTVTGDVAVNGGSLSLNSQNLTVTGGDLTVASGAVLYCGNQNDTCSAGTTTLGANSGTLGGAGATTLYHLALVDASPFPTTTLGGNVTVKGDLAFPYVCQGIFCTAYLGGHFIDLSQNNYTLYVGGNWTNNLPAGFGSPFVQRQGTVEFIAGATGKTITSTGITYYNLAFNNAAGGWTLADATTVTNNLNVTNTSATGVILGNNLGVGNRLTIAGGKLDATNKLITLSGSISDANGPLYLNGGTLTTTGSTVNFTGTGATTVAATTYNNLGVKPGANGITHTFTAGTVTVGGTLTIGNGTNTGTVSAATNATTLDANGDIAISANAVLTANADGTNRPLTVAGNWTNNGSFTHNSGKVTFDAGATGKTITSNGSAFFDLTFNNAAGGWTLQDALGVASTLTLTSGTLDLGSATLTLSGTGGAPFVINGAGVFTPSTGTVEYTGNNPSGSTTVKGTTYYGLTLNNASEDFVAGGNMTTNGNLGVTANSFTLPATFDANGNVTLSAGNTSAATNSTALTVAGNLAIGASATFTKGGTITFDGDSTITDSHAAGSLQDLGTVRVQ